MKKRLVLILCIILGLYVFIACNSSVDSDLEDDKTTVITENMLIDPVGGTTENDNSLQGRRYGVRS